MSRILVVEDDPQNVEILSRLLTIKKYEFAVATSRSEAVQLARELRPAVVLMDIRIPSEPGAEIDDTAGIEATRELKSDETTAGIRIVVTSASTFPEDIRRYREAGCDDIVSKPFTDFALLLETIDRHLREGGE